MEVERLRAELDEVTERTAAALEEAQQRGATAAILLRLANSLGTAETPDEVARRLAAAVPMVVGADRACVLLRDDESGALSVRAWHGYAPHHVAALREVVIRRTDSPRTAKFMDDPLPGYYTPAQDVEVADTLLTYGTAGVFVVPIKGRSGLVGLVTADVAPGKAPLKVSADLQDRMTGLADAAATALESARLLAREREALERLREANRLKSEFLAMVSHELRTPLAVIVGGVKTLKNQGHRMTPEDREQLVEAVIQRSEQLRGLVEDLLQTTRELKLQLAMVDLADVVRDVANEVRAAEPGLEIRCDAPGPVPVVADVHRIRQVVDNLLTNAVKYAPGSPVRVEARIDGESAVIVVVDEGPGMNEEQAARAFEPFFQGSETVSRGAGGVGLGLHITRRIVEAHGGSIRIESQPGQGTTVWLAMPAAEPATVLSA
jgi:signal transduction histidine kinase